MRHAAAAGWDQRAIVGVPLSDPMPAVGGLPPERIQPLRFETETLPFPVPGMSDVMPYRSSVWAKMTPAQLSTYRAVFRRHIAAVVDEFQPDLIHSHHIWLMSSMLKDICPNIPVVTSCHATGLRQMTLCPHLHDEVCAGCGRNDRFVVLQQQHAEALTAEVGVEAGRVAVVGAGYRAAVFHVSGRRPGTGDLVYAGKYSHSKGLPQLLDVMASRPEITLHVAGAGAGAEADALATRMDGMPNVVRHGMLDQAQLAELMRSCDVFVLPSFYEGVPLVLVEALACGCRLVCTRLPGVVSGLADALGDYLQLVEAPEMAAIDVPAPAALPTFVDGLGAEVGAALARPALTDAPTAALAPFTWRAVFARVEVVYRELLADNQPR